MFDFKEWIFSFFKCIDHANGIHNEIYIGDVGSHKKNMNSGPYGANVNEGCLGGSAIIMASMTKMTHATFDALFWG